ncbi:MAG: hypothetical protein UHW86_04095, partial [Spirochaetota bacterium]|nr:hypothetical protein [Spirochaetota bacterium]
LMTIKGDTKITAKIVGGNNGLQWKWRVGDKAWFDLQDLAAGSSYNDNIRELPMSISMLDLLKAEVGNSDDTATLQIKIIDKTENGGQEATINIRVKSLLQDTTAPTVEIKPFYWNSESDNSLYQNSRTNGHIELTEDLTDKTGALLGADDPKVSGKITIEGTANDNVRVDKLIAKIPGFKGGTEFIIATRNNDNSWTFIDNMETEGWACEIVSESFDKDIGNIVNWKFHWDTAKIENVVAKNVNVQIKAADRGKATLDSNKTKVIYGDQKSSDFVIYKMDVVPYITGLNTTLTGLEKKNPSVYGRSALGKYPVYYYRKTIEGSPKSEKITLKGFNIKSGSTVTFAGSATATLNNDMSFTLHENAKSGEIKVTVNGIDSLNNINNNEAKDGYNGSNYENYYNRQPNGQNNDLLTDNVEIAIWEINSKAAIAETGELSEVVMHVNPTNGMVGLAFAHSQDLASYPTAAKTTISYDVTKTDGKWIGKECVKDELSYHTWVTDYTGVNQIGFVYDKNGNMFGTNGGTDTYTAYLKVGRLGLISSHWGTIADSSVTADAYAGYTKFRRLRLEYLGITKNGVYASNVNRFAKGDCTQLATTTSEDLGTNLYMMYYDNTLGELKFKAGNFGKNPASPASSLNPDDPTNYSTAELWKKSEAVFGDFADDAHNQRDWNGTNYLPTYNNISIVANQNGANGDSSVRPGIYYSVSAVASADGMSDVVVAVWYDDTNKSLWYSYLVNPLGKAGNRDSNGAISTEWVKPVAILDGHAGGYCARKADDKGGIHIAAYSRKDAGSLYYAYLDKYNSTFNESKNLVAVDSYGSQGQYITMEVAKDGNGKYIPYIGYYMNSMSYPKYAYLANPGAGVKAGVDENNMYTGNWETIMLPTTSTLVLDDINIGVWKNANGTLKAIPSRPANQSGLQSESIADNKKSGIVVGNDTVNPIFAYGIAQTGIGYVETAQLK